MRVRVRDRRSWCEGRNREPTVNRSIGRREQSRLLEAPDVRGALAPEIGAVDREELDVRTLERGDSVELYLELEHRWQRGMFDISTAGIAFVELPGRVQFRLDQALLMGLRRPRRRRAITAPKAGASARPTP